MNRLAIIGIAVLSLTVLAGPVPGHGQGISPPGEQRYFAETGHTVTGRFLQYWEQHGGLAQQGYPLTEEVTEVSPIDGKTYTVQYFERAVFEHHPENSPPYDVELSLLGSLAYQQKYPSGAPGQLPSSDPAAVVFAPTGKRLGGRFLAYWQAHGGLPQQGYPLSDEFQEISALDGHAYTVQYFERAVFEWHPENTGSAYEVELAQLGTLRYHAGQAAPAPLLRPLPGYIQFGPAGNDTYLVWGEARYTPGQGTQFGSYDIKGLNLQTGQAVSVAEAPGDQTAPALAGARVVWEDRSGGDRDIQGRDLRTGESFAVATGPADQSAPTLEGDTAAWIETAGATTRVLTKDLASGAVQEIVAFPVANTTLLHPILSPVYLVWAQLTAGRTRELWAYNRRTGAKTRVTSTSAANLEYALDNQQLVWGGEDLHWVDLDQGSGAVLVPGRIETPFIRGDLVLWSMPSGSSSEGSHIWGLRLSTRQAQLLVRESGSQVGATLAGSWLVWANQGGSSDGQLGSRVWATTGSPIP